MPISAHQWPHNTPLIQVCSRPIRLISWHSQCFWLPVVGFPQIYQLQLMKSIYFDIDVSDNEQQYETINTDLKKYSEGLTRVLNVGNHTITKNLFNSNEFDDHYDGEYSSIVVKKEPVKESIIITKEQKKEEKKEEKKEIQKNKIIVSPTTTRPTSILFEGYSSQEQKSAEHSPESMSKPVEFKQSISISKKPLSTQASKADKLKPKLEVENASQDTKKQEDTKKAQEFITSVERTVHRYLLQRIEQGLFKGNTFNLYSQKSKEPTLIAKKCVNLKPEYDIFGKIDNETLLLATLSSNITRNFFELTDRFNKVSPPRKLLQHNHRKLPKRIAAYFPKTSQIDTSYQNLCQNYQTNTKKQIFKLINKPPTWNQDIKRFTLNFYGRASKASIKNFILVFQENSEELPTFLLGKQSENTFNVDIRYPLSPVQALALALTSFDYKL